MGTDILYSLILKNKLKLEIKLPESLANWKIIMNNIGCPFSTIQIQNTGVNLKVLQKI